MRIAALYDVHGNLPALEAVLAEVVGEGFDALVVGGDVVPGPMPDACLSRLRKLGPLARFIRGNGEVDVLRFHGGESPSRVPEAFHTGMRWCADRIDDEAVRWMKGWPLTVRFDVEGLGSVLFCHATPRDENEIFTERTPEDRLLPIFEGLDASVLICGHTHIPFDRRVGGLRVVNAGSVGMPFGRRGAFWVSIGPDGVTLRRTDYDLAAATRAAAATGYPDAAIMRLEDPPDAGTMIDAFERVALGGRDAGSASR
ncbi:MAG: metallophosphoesterase family protein [Gemmatimonadetes bacterium]|nr:metallophosphatase family protein [Gemmatimonadota bacterium]NNF15052.1 metallophosphoesterase family protein [Gemmatimonadota bacterium]